ncbi:MAG: PAS domain S-box protein [Firmicutes bacterium]|nr:PAS domain S-box protein [Bacillota bacterium]
MLHDIEAILVIAFCIVILLLLVLSKRGHDDLKLTRENLRLAHQKIRTKSRSAIEQERRLTAIAAFSATLNQPLSIEQVIETAVDMVKEVMQVETVFIFSLDKTAGELRITAFDGISQEYAAALDRTKIGDGACGKVAKTGKPVIVEDLDSNSALNVPGTKEEKIKSLLSVPLRAHSEIVGTLCAATKATRVFDHTEIRLLSAIGNLIGIGIENSSLNRERVVALDRLRFSEHKYRQLFENALDAIWVQDLDGKITAANHAAGELFGYHLSELYGKNIHDLLPKKNLAKFKEQQRKLLDGQDIQQPYKQRILKKDGTEAILMLTTNLVSKDGQPNGFQFIGRDITQEVRMQENQQFYLEQITKAHEEERLRIARDLHDSAAQNLIGILHKLENFCQNDEHLPMPELRSLWNLHERLKDVLQEIRQLSRDLRPSILDHLGLLPSVDWLVDQLKTDRKIAISFTVSGERRRFSPEVEVQLFRIIQEALRNIAKHAEATKVKINFNFEDDKATITIADDGKGFDLPPTLGELSRLGKLGLDGMQTRARLAGGTFDIQSKPGRGTKITITIPDLCQYSYDNESLVP